jgi:hypothetical protein
MRTIRNLAGFKSCRVYVYLKDEQTGKAFLEQAEAEGFTYCDGEKPTSREYAEIMAVNTDNTINYVGAVGRVAFGAGAPVGNKKLLRIDFAKYAADQDNYEYRPE